jgi:hypothetical protein
MKIAAHVIRRLAVAAGVCTLTSAPVLAADPMTDPTFISARDIKWGDPPPALPKGAKFAVLYGDPGKAGPYVIRLMLPVGYKIAPHWHTLPENLTVISGTFYLATGDTMDRAHAHPLKEGGFHYLPAKAHHSAYAGSKTIVQVHGEGPFDITYINPADDPQKPKK